LCSSLKRKGQRCRRGQLDLQLQVCRHKKINALNKSQLKRTKASSLPIGEDALLSILLGLLFKTPKYLCTLHVARRVRIRELNIVTQCSMVQCASGTCGTIPFMYAAKKRLHCRYLPSRAARRLHRGGHHDRTTQFQFTFQLCVMTPHKLVIDADRVRGVGYRRLVKVLDNETKCAAVGSVLPLEAGTSIARCIHSTLEHGIKEMEGREENGNVVQSLRSHRCTALQLVQRYEAEVLTRTQPTSSESDTVGTRTAEVKSQSKIKNATATALPAADETSSHDDASSGQRIKFLLQDQKVLQIELTLPTVRHLLFLFSLRCV
jgi:hypothetical protein